MFNIAKHEATISNVNTRIERHGDERQLAADIKFTTSASNAVLDQFDPGLREALFRKPGKGEQQSLPTIGEALTAVKFPSLAPLKLEHEFAGYEVEIGGLLDEAEPLFLADVKLKKFAFAPEGRWQRRADLHRVRERGLRRAGRAVRCPRARGRAADPGAAGARCDRRGRRRRERGRRRRREGRGRAPDRRRQAGRLTPSARSPRADPPQRHPPPWRCAPAPAG